MINVIKEKITVREFVRDDFPQFVTQLCNNPEWNQVFQLWDVNEDGAVQLFTHHFEEYKEYNIKDLGLMFGIFTNDGKLVGECGFEFNKGMNAVEVFMGLITSEQGKGYSREILDALCDISKELGINKINANVPEAHAVAIKLFDNSKFIFENEYDLEVGDDLTVKMRHYVLKND